MRPSKTSTGHNNTSAALLISVKKYRDTSQTYNEPSRIFTATRQTYSNDYNWRRQPNSNINSNDNNTNYARTSFTTTINKSSHNNKGNHRN